jgi:N-acetylglucosaminyldiphosphoundecaprenol N-acetyl-beta-D-mannosaminyltransferase
LKAHLDEIMGRVARGEGAWLLTLNTEMLARSVRDPDYLGLMKTADIITADGMPLVWASRFKAYGAAIAGRTTGVDLVHAFLRSPDMPAFAVIGGRSPTVTIHTYGPQAVQACKFVFEDKVDLSEAQLSMFCRELEQRQVKVVFIALGVPKQDHLASQLRQRLPHLVLTGIGGTFEILGPGGGRAPGWMQRTGLEWLYRFSKEPARLWKRYLVSYPVGVWHLLKDCVSSRA